MNIEDDLFFKIAEGGRLDQVGDISEADFVQVPIDRYISLEEWSELMDRYETLRNQSNDDMDVVTIGSEEYHGLLNALRIIRDRSLQQIDKSKADEHGYTLKYADMRIYDRIYPEYKACYVTKTTPVSMNTDLLTAKFLIEHDLKEYYNYIDLPVFDVTDISGVNSKKLTKHDLLIAVKQSSDESYNSGFYVENSDYGYQVKRFMDSIEGPFIFETSKITGNIGQGVYDVSYWATGFV